MDEFEIWPDRPLVPMAIYRLIMEKKRCCHFFSAVFYPILFILAGNNDMNESLEEFVLSPGYRVTGLIMNKSFTDHIQMILPWKTYLSIASQGLDQNTRWKGFLATSLIG